MFSAGSFWNHKAPPKKKKKNANAVEVRQVIYFNCVDFFRPGIFFQISMGHIVSFNFHQIYPTFKKESTEREKPHYFY